MSRSKETFLRVDYVQSVAEVASIGMLEALQFV